MPNSARQRIEPAQPPRRHRLPSAIRQGLLGLTLSGLGLSQAAAQGFPGLIELADLNTPAGFPGLTVLGPGNTSDTGFRVTDAGDMNGDGFADFAVGAWNSNVNGLFSGQVFLVLGQETLPDVIDLAQLNQPGQPAGLVINGQGGDRIGRGIGGGFDLDGDGLDDLILGATVGNRALIVFGRDDGGLEGTLELSGFNSGSTPDGIVVLGSTAADGLGMSATRLGDVNGDGLDDIAIGAYRSNSFAGTAHVIFGRPGGSFPATIDLADLNGIGPNATPGIQINGELSGDRLGDTLTGPIDLNGDGFDDIVVAAPGAGADNGRVYVVFGNNGGALPGTINLASLGSAGIVIDGFSANGIAISAGTSLANAGDIDRDGIDDLLIGAFRGSPDGRSLAGQAFLVYGGGGLPATIALDQLNGATANATPGVTFNGIGNNDLAGYAVAGIGDLNGDGFADLAIGAYGVEETTSGYFSFRRGATYVVFGRDDADLPDTVEFADLNTAAATGTPGIVVRGSLADDQSGFALSAAGDLDGDGLTDLLIGAPGGGLGDGGNRAHVLFSGAVDVAIVKSNGAQFIDPESGAVYTIDVVNKGPFDYTGVAVEDILPAELDAVAASWTCTAFDGASCSASGTGDLVDSIDLPGKASVRYTLTAPLLAPEGALIVNTATVTLPGGVTDVDPADNSSTDRDPTGLFIDGFDANEN